MWATVIAASETFLRLPFFNLCRKHRKLLAEFFASAMGAFPDALIAA
jgi:hypothetical protein